MRWVNVEGRNTAALRYALSCILEHPDLAFNSITAPKQRVKTHMWEEQKYVHWTARATPCGNQSAVHMQHALPGAGCCLHSCEGRLASLPPNPLPFVPV